MLSINKRFHSIKTFFTEYRWALLCGILTGTSYIPFFPWAALFNFAPLWWYWANRAQSRKQILWSGWISQFVLNLIGFHWVFHTAYEFGHIPTPISFLVLLLFAAAAHLYIPLAGWIFFAIKQRWGRDKSSFEWSDILLLTGLWSLFELYWPYIFQWHMGYTLLWAKLPAYHLADIFGFQGLSTILLLLNGIIVYFATQKKNDPILEFAKGFGLSLLLFVLLNIWGWREGLQWQNHPDEKTINFLPIQANIGNTERIMAERGYGYQDFITQKFLSMSQQALQKYPEAQILIWPESAIPDYLDQTFESRLRPRMLKQFLTQTQKALITGAYSKELSGLADDSAYNALFMFGPDGNALSGPYRKKHLLAFGEYTPFADWFPKLNDISPSGKGFSRGPGPRSVMISTPSTGTIKIAPQICYEALYPDFTREGVLQGAQILVNVTNDSWFGRYSEPYQHLSMTLARTIENRRPLIRVTNTGFTSGIEASGKLLPRSPLYEEWSQLLKVKYLENPSLTLYTRYGGYWPFVVVLLTIGGLFGVIYKKRIH